MWEDFPDYVLGITKAIWEDRHIDGLHRWYADDLAVRSPASVVRGNESIIAAIMATLAEFPDRQLLGEDVIWCGDEDEGFFSSHRILSTATHSWPGVYGIPTGKKLRYRILADCFAIDDKIEDEWIIRDQGAIVREIGWDPKDFARALIEREGGPENCIKPFTPKDDVCPRYNGRGNEHEISQRYAEILTRIMGAELSVIPGEYDRACHLEMPGGVTDHGREAADRFWLGLRSSFPSAEFRIEHHIGRSDENMPQRAALRWSLHGRHDGWGAFGAPTDADVYIMGIATPSSDPEGSGANMS